MAKTCCWCYGHGEGDGCPNCGKPAGDPLDKLAAALKQGPTCECDLMHRRWNPGTGRCENCGRRYRDTRDDARRQG